MQRYLPPILTLAVLTIAAVVLTVTVGAQGDSSSRSAKDLATDQTGGAIAGACAPGLPDCVDTIGGGGGSVPSCAKDPNCIDVITCPGDSACQSPPCPDMSDSACRPPPCPNMTERACVDEKPPVPPDNNTGLNPCPPDLATCPATEYAVAIDFTTAYTQEDMDIAEKLLQGFDPAAQFLLLETFPPMGRATVSTSDAAFCELLQAKLSGRAGIGRIGCEPAPPPAPGAPDEPVSSTPDTRR